jgi:hypothetical protein
MAQLLASDAEDQPMPGFKDYGLARLDALIATPAPTPPVFLAEK